MADEINIEYDDDDGESIEDLIQRIKDSQASPQSPQQNPASQESPNVQNDTNVSRSTPLFNPAGQNDEARKLVNQDQRTKAKERRETQSEQRRLLREQQADERRERRDDIQNRKGASQSEVTQARSDAISQRVAAYGLSSALGFPGYIGASIIDSNIIRPREEERVDRENTYQDQLRDYQRNRETEQIQNRRRSEEAIRNRPIDATPIDSEGRPTQVSGGGIPPQFPGGPTYPQGAGAVPPQQQPPIVPPNRPDIENTALIDSLMAGAGTITAGIKIGQMVNAGVDSFFQKLGNATDGITRNDATQTIKGGLEAGQGIIDPLGSNVAVNVAVDGFNLLLDLNKGILENIKGDQAFAPQTLMAGVEGDLLRLERQITNAQKLDNVTAELVRANTQFDLAFSEFRAEFLRGVAPLIIANLKLLTATMKGTQLAVSGSADFLAGIHPNIAAIFGILKYFADNHEKDKFKDLDDGGIMAELDRFFRPVNQRPRNGGMPLT